MYCVVKNCKSFWKPNSDIKFHSFPKNEVKRKKWLSIVPIKGKMYQHARICSLHFKPEDYDPGKKFLLKNVVPFYLPHPCNCGSTVMTDEACSDCMELSTSTNIEDDGDPLSVDMNTTQDETTLEESERNDACSDCMELSTSINEADINDPLSDDSCQSYSYTTQKETALEESEKNIILRALLEQKIDSQQQNSQAKPGPSKDSIAKFLRTLKPKIVSQQQTFRAGPSKDSITVNIDTQDEPPAKRACFKDFSVQVKIKTPREISLLKNKRAMQRKINRQQEKIKKLESLLSTVKKYTNNTEIENILQGNFANICKLFDQEPKTKVLKYSDEVKGFALTVHSYSPQAYEYLRNVISLPHTSTLFR
ncbi:uncharacterized protein LOC123704708 [Colias croceus]|uniref:uncharacterized protein LOC123704708 n=1 Tax=Colias crocea TaxID=72248 RepID=UPI001E27DACB|nr:uncharacterized protein LOC123704708 [Colias croceus]